MKIGITINNILRDHVSQVITLNKIITERDPITPINPFNLEKSFPKINGDVDYPDFNLDNEIKLVENDDDVNFDINRLMYHDASFEVFGRSDIIDKNIFLKLKQLERKYKIEFILLNKESEKSRNATLFFLSKNNFNLKQIIFPDKYNEFWEYVDVIVTDNPKILRYKPENKIAIKYNNDFNKNSKCDFLINDLNQLHNILKKITKNK